MRYHVKILRKCSTSVLSYVIILKWRAMCKLEANTDFCIFIKTSLLFLPTKTLTVLSSPLEYPASTSRMMLCWSMRYPLNCCFSSSRKGAYFSVFSWSFAALLSTHGQLISKMVTIFRLWSTTLASIRLALTTTWSAYSGTSQKACASALS